MELLWKSIYLHFVAGYFSRPYGQRNSLSISLRLIDRIEYVNELVQRTVG